MPYAEPAAVARIAVGKISAWKMWRPFEKKLLTSVYANPKLTIAAGALPASGIQSWSVRGRRTSHGFDPAAPPQ